MAQGQQDSDSSLDILWTIGLVVVVLLIVWYFGGNAIAKWLTIFKRLQLMVVRTLCSLVPSIQLSWLNIDGPKLVSEIDATLHQMQGVIKAADDALDLVAQSGKETVRVANIISVQDLIAMLRCVGDYWRYFYMMVIAALISYLLLNPRSLSNFRKVFNTATLRQSEQEVWPHITPVISLNLVNTKLDNGPWAMTRSPMNYCKHNKLLIVNRNDSGEYDVKLDREAASCLLADQLGPKWSELEYLPEHTQALFAIFAARIANDKKSADKLMDQISRSAKSAQLNFSGTQELLKKYANHKAVRMIVANHAYVSTVMASMLEGARGIGVLASAEFLWLKPIDRSLWYMLNTVGRSTAVAEICGAYAHWIAELRNGGPFFSPMVGEAIKGLEIALTELIYHPDEEEETGSEGS